MAFHSFYYDREVPICVEREGALCAKAEADGEKAGNHVEEGADPGAHGPTAAFTCGGRQNLVLHDVGGLCSSPSLTAIGNETVNLDCTLYPCAIKFPGSCTLHSHAGGKF